MNKVYHFLFAIVVVLLTHHFVMGQSSCLSGTVTFSTQTQIDDFPVMYPGCVSINANVIIAESSSGGITNLDGLQQVVNINGYLNIGKNVSNGNSSLTSLNGLHNLTGIAGGLFLYNNDALSDISALSGLSGIPGDLNIESNDALSNLTGLGAVTSVSGQLYIKDNSGLLTLQGLNSLSSVSNLLYIDNNDALVNLGGLNSLQSIGAGLFIYYNNSLNDITALSNLAVVGGALKLIDNDNLATLDGLQNISHTSINELNLLGNALLSTCHVMSICNYLGIPSSTAIIGANASGCNTRSEVETLCSPLALPSKWNESFELKVVRNEVRMQWSDIEAPGGDIHYSVERSRDGRQFESLGVLKTNIQGKYVFMDENPFLGDIFYRVRKYEMDKVQSQTAVRQIVMKNSKPWQLFNVNDGRRGLIIDATDNVNYTVRIVDMQNKVISSTRLMPGKNRIDITDFPKGVYHVVDTRQGLSQTFIR